MERFWKMPAGHEEPKMWKLEIKVKSSWRSNLGNLGTAPLRWAVHDAPATWGGRDRGGESLGNPSHPERRPQVPACVPGEPLRDQFPKAGVMTP